jgi:hypothetical protein
MENNSNSLNPSATSNGEMRTYDSGGFREADAEKPSYYGIPPIAMLRLAWRCRYGFTKYGYERGWEKWLPATNLIGSAQRHLNEYLMGDDSEDHLAALMWNIAALMETEIRCPEYIDIPERKCKKIYADSKYFPGTECGRFTGTADRNVPGTPGK